IGATVRMTMSDSRTLSPEDAPPEAVRPGDDLVQLLDPQGLRQSHPISRWITDVDDELIASLYEDLVSCRRIDAEATALQRQGELALWPPMRGQEAAQIGSARALRSDDFVFSSYREH